MKIRVTLRRAKLWAGCAAACMCMVVPETARAAQDTLLSVTEESQILPIEDESGKYLLKSDGFYCLNADGSRDSTPCVHYFDHFVIDGTVFNGYYYHDESGEFVAGNPTVKEIRQITVPLTNTNTASQTDSVEWANSFDGYYMVGNLGKLSATPQVRYMDNLTMGTMSFNGFYFFDEYGKLLTEPGIHHVEMNSNGCHFDGDYYFGGTNGALLQQAGTTPEGYVIDQNGKVQDFEEPDMGSLKPQLESMLSSYEGTWSVYVKDLNTGEEILINDQPLYSASLIKLFVLAQTYRNMSTVLQNEAKLLNSTPDNPSVKTKVEDLMWNMITVSDNESTNELVRLQTEKHDFLEGAKAVNEYLEKKGYQNTTLQNTLHPSSSPVQGLGGRNLTSAKECGMLLEHIYKGECVSKEASEEMLDMLLNQQNTWKIPEGLDSNIKVANKTGETDDCQHDVAIVYGEKTTYILCVMSQDIQDENTAVENIRNISKITYTYLNY